MCKNPVFLTKTVLVCNQGYLYLKGTETVKENNKMCKYGITVLSSRSKRSHRGPETFFDLIGGNKYSWSWKRQDDGRFALSIFNNRSHIATCYTDGEIYMGTGAKPTQHDLITENLELFLDWAKNWLKKNKWAKTWKPKA